MHGSVINPIGRSKQAQFEDSIRDPETSQNRIIRLIKGSWNFVFLLLKENKNYDLESMGKGSPTNGVSCQHYCSNHRFNTILGFTWMSHGRPLIRLINPMLFQACVRGVEVVPLIF